MEEKISKTYVGLDIGTNSVGWAVTDQDYRIIKKGGKSLWGIRLFDEAQTAKKRRAFRTTRRRLDRRKQRINLLQEIFEPEIMKIDPQFFTRLHESGYCKEDKTTGSKFSLFNDQGFNDSDYRQKYKTIYHLQQELISETNTKFDIRLIYLACHHLIKYRGHFLNKGGISSDSSDAESLKNSLNCIVSYYQLNPIMADDREFSFETKENVFEKANFDEFRVAIEKASGKNELKKVWSDFLFSDQKTLNQLQKIIVSLLSGFEVNLSKIGLSDSDEEKICLNSDVESWPQLGSEPAELLRALKGLYDWSVCQRLMAGKKYLCEAMIAKYDQYHSDLCSLRYIYKTYLPEDYRKMHNYKKPYKKSPSFGAYNEGKCKREEFIRELKKSLDSIKDKAIDDERFLVFYNRPTESWLVKINNTDNAVFPYQFSENELKQILDNQSKFYPFLDDPTSKPTAKEKIIKLLTFTIPYFVGPIDYHNKSKHAWIAWKEKGRVLPWNFEDIVDLDQSEQNFIRRMTNNCTYLPDEPVLPKSSLLYSEFEVLNEINKIKINNMPVDVEFKNKIFDLFRSHGSISLKQLKKFVESEGKYSKPINISGLDDSIKSNLKSFYDFEKILNHKILSTEIDMIEDIIAFITVSDDKERVRKYIASNYSDRLSQEQINLIAKLKYRKYGNFSKKFLNGTEVSYHDDKTDCPLTIIDLMHETNQNLMEILYNRQYHLLEKIQKFKKHNETNENLNEKIEELSVSPMIKRPIKQTMLILKELKKIIGHDFDKIFVEVNRYNGKKGKISSRKKHLEHLYKDIEKTLPEICRLNDELSNCNDSDLKQDRLYLYFTQKGRCMYSGEKIDINELFDKHKYDIDHIIPQSLIKNDSLDNKVMVLSKINYQKRDKYPLSKVLKIDDKMKDFWKKLKDQNLISTEKLNWLLRNEELTEDELNQFINRQITATSWSEQCVIELLHEIYPNTDIKGVKAGLVSEFRKNHDLFKVREINDIHHAQDAYLNIVVGNVVNSIYCKINAMGKEMAKTYNPTKFFEFNSPGIWNKESSLEIVKKYYYHHDVLFTTMKTTGKGAFYEEKATSPKDTKSELNPIKDTGPLANSKVYGGYNSEKTAYFSLIEFSKGKKIQKAIVGIPVIVKSKIKLGQITLEKYLEEHYSNPKIIVKCIKKGSIVQIKDSLCEIRGKTGAQITFNNHSQWYPDEWTINYINSMVKLGKKEVKDDLDQIQVYYNESSHSKKIKFLTKADNLKLYDILVEQLKKKIYNGLPFNTILSKLADPQIRSNFEGASIGDQVKTLSEIIKSLECKGIVIDLSKICSETDRAKHLGSLILSSNLTSPITLIFESVTGYYVAKRKI